MSKYCLHEHTAGWHCPCSRRMHRPGIGNPQRRRYGMRLWGGHPHDRSELPCSCLQQLVFMLACMHIAMLHCIRALCGNRAEAHWAPPWRLPAQHAPSTVFGRHGRAGPLCYWGRAAAWLHSHPPDRAGRCSWRCRSAAWPDDRRRSEESGSGGRQRRRSGEKYGGQRPGALQPGRTGLSAPELAARDPFAT